MGEINVNINKKTSISVARNTPVALVVGAAGFLGSHLVDKLLSKNIQVIGVDGLESGKRDYLKDAAGNKNFHPIIQSAEDMELELPRLDYIFIATSGNWNLDRVLSQFKKHKARLLFISSIDLYDKEKIDKGLSWFKETEIKIARFAEEYKLNARILRLGSVYGPRMHFRTKDPIIRLIQQALSGDLQKEISLEFSSRALYVDDAIDLIIKTIFSGATAQRIFDGVLPAPIKVSEIKQVLLDPVWYENRAFSPTELPPWPTPNLLKTIKFLNWNPSKRIVFDLRETLNYFKENEIAVPRVEVEELPEKSEKEVETKEWKKEKELELESFKEKPKKEGQKPRRVRFININRIFIILALLLIGYALVWPAVTLGWGILSFRSSLQDAVSSLGKGEFDKSLADVDQAEAASTQIKSTLDDLTPIRNSGILQDQFKTGDNLTNLADLSVSASKATILGVKALFMSLKSVTGELNDSPSGYFTTAQVELASANDSLSQAFALLNDPDFKSHTPGILKPRIKELSDKLTIYSNLVKKAQSMSSLLPNVVGLDGPKNYLVLLQNNMELRPTGGFIGSYADVSFAGGKLKNLQTNDIYAIDGQLSLAVEPPKEIKSDLGQNRWFLRDSNWEPDFPTAARQAEWFYTKETGQRVEGVVALDISAMQDLLSVVGPLDLADYSETITSDNLFERALAHAELSFFAGSQAKKSFLTALTTQLFDKLFFLPNQNWSGIVTSLGKSLDQKHMSIYLDDPRMLSYLVAEDWAHVMPRESDANSSEDFLAPVEANLGADKVNYYLDRSYSLDTVIDKNGEVKHTLKITYLNRSPSDAFPGGIYKNRMRIYLPFGSTLDQAFWGNNDITASVTSFVDYGRSGYSFLVELNPKEQKILTLNYSVPIKLNFQNNKASYKLDVVKEAGTLKDPFNWTITYPLGYQLASDQAHLLGPQQQTIKTDLSIDRSFEINFTK